MTLHSRQMRPASIKTFEKALFASLATTVVGTAISWNTLAAVTSDPRAQALGLGQGWVIGSVIFNLAIYVLLWFFIAKRASTVAKWIFVVLTAIGLLMFAQALAGLAQFSLAQVLGIVALALQVYAAWQLFKPDAKAWLETRSPEDETSGPAV